MKPQKGGDMGQARVFALLPLCLALAMPVLAQHEDRRFDWVHGSFDTGIDIEHSDRDGDISLNQSLRLQIDPPGHPRLRFRGSVWLDEDLDGDESSASGLRDINDASSSNVRARLLYLYLDVNDLPGGSSIRIGRQRMNESPSLSRFDGLSLRWRQAAWRGYVFGGVRASIHTDASDDPVLGAGVSYAPSHRTRVAADLFYAQENRSTRDTVFRLPYDNIFNVPFPRRVRKKIRDETIALSLWHNISENHRLFVRYFWKNGNGDEFRFSVSGDFPKADLTYEAALRTQLTSAGDQANGGSSFFRVLGKFEPFYNLFLAIHRPVSEKTMLSFEIEVNEARNDDPFSANRDFQRYGLIVSTEDVFDTVDITVALERWAVESGEGTWSLSGEVAKKWESVRLSTGVDFERYEDRVVRFNAVPGQLEQLAISLLPGIFPAFNSLASLFNTSVVRTHENVYSFYARTRWDISETQELRTRVSYEIDDGPDSPYWRLRMDYSIRF